MIQTSFVRNLLVPSRAAARFSVQTASDRLHIGTLESLTNGKGRRPAVAFKLRPPDKSKGEWRDAQGFAFMEDGVVHAYGMSIK